MENIKIQQLNIEAIKLFSATKNTLASSSLNKLRSYSKYVPSKFVDDNKKIRIVFIGQYSAGKSSILSILTGKKLKVGQGVTTDKCNFINWNGIEVVDTPGIHTQNRPDHDKLTYDAVSEADLLVFVCTAEGFSRELGTHFRKLLIEKGKGHEMMLVINKMESSMYGNTKEGQEVLFGGDILPVISPEFTSEDLFITYIDTEAYLDSLEEKGKNKELLLKISGYPTFYDNINKFLKKKKVLGKCTTSLYSLEQLLSDALSEFKTDDFCVDGSLNLLNQQRKQLVEAREHLKTALYNIIRRKTQEVRNWGYNIANELHSSDSEDKVKTLLEEKYKSTDLVYQEAVKEIKNIVAEESEELQKFANKLENSEFAHSLKAEISRRIGKINISEKSVSRLNSGATALKSTGTWLSKFATSQNACLNWNAIFKLSTYSGSKAHETVLTVGHFFGHKFRPWEAVKTASKIGKFGKIIGVGGALLSVGLQIYQDSQDEKTERALIAYRSDIRNSFSEAANAIDMHFDKESQTWVRETIDSKINEIDRQIIEIEDSQNRNNAEFNKCNELLKKTRHLIAEIQKSIK